MLKTSSVDKVYLALGATDLRKSIDGLAIMVQECFKLDVFSRCLFVFCNKKKDKIKILHWEYNGFWLYYKRLEKSTFRWPSVDQHQKTIAVSERELRWLLDGLSLDQTLAHQPVKERLII